MSQKSSVLNSELAVTILSTIASRREGDYSTNLADQLDKCQSSISRLLSELHELGFIEKGKREKVQYYRVNYEEIADYWYSELQEKLEEENEDKSLARLEENNEKIKEVAAKFFSKLLKSYNPEPSNLNLSEVIFGGFMFAIGHNQFQDHEFTKKNPFLVPALKSLGLHLQELGYCTEMGSALKESIEETEK